MNRKAVGLLIGTWLWASAGGAIYHHFGWHKLFQIWFVVTVSFVGWIWDYTSMQKRAAQAERDSEVRRIHERLEVIEAQIGYLRSEITYRR